MTEEQFDTLTWQKGFNQWMAEVDRVLLKRSGFTSDCLADQTYADWYEDGITPAEAAELTLADEGFPGE